MRDFLKYVCVCALAYLGLLVYATLLALLVAFILPAKPHPDLGLESTSLGHVLAQAWWTGSLLALLTSPLLGIAVMRGANHACEKPGDERSWWRHAHRSLALNLIAAVLTGVLLTGAVLAWTAHTDDPRPLRELLGRAVYLGATVGVVLISLGATLRAFAGAPDESEE